MQAKKHLSKKSSSEEISEDIHEEEEEVQKSFSQSNHTNMDYKYQSYEEMAKA